MKQEEKQIVVFFEKGTKVDGASLAAKLGRSNCSSG